MNEANFFPPKHRKREALNNACSVTAKHISNQLMLDKRFTAKKKKNPSQKNHPNHAMIVRS